MMEVTNKLYYKIGEVCEITGIEAHVLRYWESEFPVLHPLKNSAGQRVYRRKDIELVLRIKRLLYQDGFTIAGAKRQIRESLAGIVIWFNRVDLTVNRLELLEPGGDVTAIRFVNQSINQPVGDEKFVVD